MIGWLGALFIIIGRWGIGDKNRKLLLFSMVGDACYIIHTFQVGDWPIFFAAWIFLALGVRAYIKWGKQ